MNEHPPETPVEVPLEKLQDHVLQALIEAFVLREGTDYGDMEISHKTKMDQVHRQLQRKDLRIIFDAATETVTFITAADWKKINPQV